VLRSFTDRFERHTSALSIGSASLLPFSDH
jgi:hypothetical protein